MVGLLAPRIDKAKRAIEGPYSGAHFLVHPDMLSRHPRFAVATGSLQK
jgi:hypothetical protein